MSIAALPAALYLAISQRDEELSDSALYSQFVVLFALAALLMYGLLQEPAIRRSVDPQAQLAHELDTHPVLAALQQGQHSMKDQILTAVVTEVSRGRSVQDAVRAVHPLLFRVAQDRLSWADAQTTLNWMEVHAEQLDQLAQRSVEQCAALALLRAEGIAALAGGLDPELADRVEARLVELLANAALGLAKQHPPVESLDFNAFRRFYDSAVGEPLRRRYGDKLARQLASPILHQQAEPAGDPVSVCAARREQLRLIGLQPSVEAARMFKAVRQ